MPTLRYTRRATSDLRRIAMFLVEAGAEEEHSRRVANDLRAKCRALAALPGALGRPRPELGEGLRSFPFRGYVIFFRYRDDLFEVVDVLDGRRDVDAAIAPD